jgi:hypothetical protein
MPKRLPRFTELTFRAWHHFPAATPLIPALLQAFHREGFKVRALRTRLRAVAPNGRIYSIRRAGNDGIAVKELRGKVVKHLNAVELSELIKRRGYAEAGRAIRRVARQTRRHAGF